MSDRFDITFRNTGIAKAAENAFNAVNTQHGDQDGRKGAIFCQLREWDLLLFKKEHGDKLNLIGSYLPPKWAARIGRILDEYKKEQLAEKTSKPMRRRK